MGGVDDPAKSADQSERRQHRRYFHGHFLRWETLNRPAWARRRFLRDDEQFVLYTAASGDSTGFGADQIFLAFAPHLPSQNDPPVERGDRHIVRDRVDVGIGEYRPSDLSG